MQNTPTSEVVAGSQLAKPVLDQNGRVLLRSGAILTERVIARLEQWQVSSVCIETSCDAEARSERPATCPPESQTPWKQAFDQMAPSPERDILEKAFRTWSEAVTTNSGQGASS